MDAFLRIFTFLLLWLTLAVNWAYVTTAEAAPKKDKPIIANDDSDLNRDGQVDYGDLIIFSSKLLEQNVDAVDWCQVYDDVAAGNRVYGKQSTYFQKHYGTLLGYIHDRYDCDGGPLLLAVVNEPVAAARVALDDATGKYYVSDPRVGSVFIYDANWVLVEELKHLDRPLGVAIDHQGYLLVGSEGTGEIDVFDPANGDKLFTFGTGRVRMPNAITIGPGGEIYVTDSKAHRVWEFSSSYDPAPVRAFGEPGPGDGQLKFPTDTELVTRDSGTGPVTEIYVADQVNQRIQVFDLHGNFVRTLAPPNVEEEQPRDPDANYDTFFCRLYGYPRPGYLCPPEPKIRGSYTRLFGLDSDSQGRLHVIDGFDAIGAIVDPVTGDLISYYSDWGSGPGLLKVPMDILVTAWGQAIVTDGKEEIEVFPVP